VNRWATASVAFAVGLGGAFAAVEVSQTTDVHASGDLLGSADFAKYCVAIHGDRSVPVLRQPDANGWNCAGRSNGLFATFPVQLDDLCARQFGRPSFSSSWDTSWPYSWECFYGSRP
jgi:hypothetical protein